MRTRALPLYGPLLLGLAACSAGDAGGGDAGPSADAAPKLPPRVCRQPGALGAGPYFKDVTAAYGIDAKGLAVAGIRLATADIDGDGYPDLVVHLGGSNNRDDLKATPKKRFKRVLMNRPRTQGSGRRFVDRTDASGFTAIRGGGLGRASHLVVFADVNNDGRLDAFSGTYTDPRSKTPDPGDRSEILLGDGKGGFKLGPRTGVSHKEMLTTTSATFLDYDRDGNIDLFVGFWYEIYGYLFANEDRLYRGLGDGRFVEVTQKVGLSLQRSTGFDSGKNRRPTYGVTSCDVDGDGDTDILVSAYGRQWNLLWRNDGGRFTEVGRASGFAADDNVDYADNEFYRCYCQTTGSCKPAPPRPRISCGRIAWGANDSKPWRNGGNTFTTVCGDVDNDGDMDLFNAEIRHWHIGKSSDPSQLLLNTGKKPLRFTRPGLAKLGLARTHVSPSWNEGDISAAFLDFDNDGLTDIILMDSDYPDTHTWLFRQKPDHTFVEISKKAGIAHPRGQQVTVADLDGDGDLDVVMGTSRARGGPKVAQVHVFENVAGARGNWLRVRLVGGGAGMANRAGIGARVTVKAGGVTQTQEVGGGYGTFGMQNDLVLHFGLGKACDVDQVTVRWPDKKASTQTFRAVRGNYVVVIDQKAGTLRYVRP